MFEDIPWSTADVYRLTVERADEIGVPVVTVPLWYDVDDRADLAPARGGAGGRATLVRRVRPQRSALAPATRRFIEQRQAPLAAETSW